MSTKGDKKAAKKKNKGNKDKNKDKLTQVDKTFYELTIADLNKKLSRLRSQLITLEDSNNNLNEKIRSLNEDRVDVAAHLERTLVERNELITELEDRLIEITQLRMQEKEQFGEHIKDLEGKHKSMHDQLTSEIKLLNGKLNSLDEFRIQRENLLCKVDDLEALIKENERKHQEVLYKIEQKAVVEKDSLKREVEEKLLQVSDDFTRSNEIRNAGYTRRLIRENIALQKEIDVLVLAQMQMQDDLNEQIEKHRIIVEQYNALDKLKNQLIYSSKNKITIIDKLSANYERLKKKYTEIVKYKTLYENTKKRDVCDQFTFKDASKKMHNLGKRLDQVKLERNRLTTMYKLREREIHRLSMAMQEIKTCVISAIDLKAEDEEIIAGHLNAEETKNFRDLRRRGLLHELMNIINQNETPVDISTSVITVSRTHSSVYRPGRMGIIPRGNTSLMEIFKRNTIAPSYVDTVSGEIKLQDKTSKTVPAEHCSHLGSIVDVELGSTLYVSSSQENLEKDGGTEDNVEEVEEEQSSSGLVVFESKTEGNSDSKSNENLDAATVSRTEDAEAREDVTEVPDETHRSNDMGFPTADNDEFDINLFY